MQTKLLLSGMTIASLIMAGPVAAQSASASADIECRVTATGAYGQATELECDGNAHAEVDGGTQVVEIGSTVTCDEFEYRDDGTRVCVHDTINAGVDAGMMAAIFGLVMTGGAVAATRFAQ